jgi:hypothetical protein
MLCAESPGTCSAGEFIIACEARTDVGKGSTDPSACPYHRVRYTLGDGIIVANLVPLGQVLAGNYRPLTAQLVTF